MNLIQLRDSDLDSKAADDVDYLSRIDPPRSVRILRNSLYYFRRHGQQITEHSKWFDMQGINLLTIQMKDCGIAAINGEDASAASEKTVVEAFMQLSNLPLNGSALAESMFA